MPRPTRPGSRTIVELAARYDIDCDLERKPAFIYTRDEDEVAADRGGGRGSRARFGLPASLTRDTGLPFDVLAAMRWDDQAQFHPVKYVKGLAATMPGDGCHVFEQSRVDRLGSAPDRHRRRQRRGRGTWSWRPICRSARSACSTPRTTRTCTR